MLAFDVGMRVGVGLHVRVGPVSPTEVGFRVSKAGVGSVTFSETAAVWAEVSGLSNLPTAGLPRFISHRGFVASPTSGARARVRSALCAASLVVLSA